MHVVNLVQQKRWLHYVTYIHSTKTMNVARQTTHAGNTAQHMCIARICCILFTCAWMYMEQHALNHFARHASKSLLKHASIPTPPAVVGRRFGKLLGGLCLPLPALPTSTPSPSDTRWPPLPRIVAPRCSPSRPSILALDRTAADAVAGLARSLLLLLGRLLGLLLLLLLLPPFVGLALQLLCTTPAAAVCME